LNVTVKLFGTLGKDFPGYDSLNNMNVNIPDDARIKDLLAHLGIPETKGYVVTINNAIVKPEDILVNGTTLQIFQALSGG